MAFLRACAFALLCTCLFGGLARAETAASDWVREDQVELRLIAAQTAVGEDGKLRLGLQFKIAPGWKTYWRTPGDAGLPVRIDWAGSRNLADAAIKWPAPERFELFGLDTFGYGGEVVFPIEARAERPGEPVTATAAVDYLVCEKICIPYNANLTVTLPTGQPAASAFVHAIDRFSVQVPGDGTAHGLHIERAQWDGDASPAITVVASAREAFKAPDLFVEGPPGWTFGRPVVTLTNGATRAVLHLPARPDIRDNATALTGQEVRLTLVDGERSAERALALEAGAATTGWSEFAAILLIALLGGLVLNLMPCVLPVLALKLISFVGLRQAERRVARTNFVAAAAGIVFAFVGLAAALNGLKAAGFAIGWGIQFQSPTFLVAMAFVLSLFAANLWGWFEFRLPSRLAGAVPNEREGPVGAFVTGIFATLLATPCSAPFVGTAVGFALSRGAVETFAVFIALGLGLSAPFLAVAAAPGIARLLPRPGAWMVRLRAGLGLLLIATAFWLLFVMAAEAGWSAAGAVAILIFSGLAILAFGRRVVGERPRWAALAVLAVIAFVVPSGLGVHQSGDQVADATPAGAIDWHPFDLTAVRERASEGQVVLVDVTAEWCLTCKVNKALVLTRGDVGRILSDGGVIAVRADWTRPDDRISAYLASFGRYGIPFNAVYGPNARNGIALPEILTADVVLDAFNRAR